MKLVLWIVVLSCSISMLFAQDTENTPREETSTVETLFPGNARFSGYGGPVVKFSPVKGSMGVFVGGYGGILINSTLMIGGGGYGLATNTQADQSVAPGQSIGVGYGGLILEYIGSSNQAIHYAIQFFAGWGGATYYYRTFDRGIPVNTGRNTTSADGFFVMEPGLYLELNMTRWFRFGVGASYRYVNGVELNGLTNNDLSNVSANLTFKFGKF